MCIVKAGTMGTARSPSYTTHLGKTSSILQPIAAQRLTAADVESLLSSVEFFIFDCDGEFS